MDQHGSGTRPHAEEAVVDEVGGGGEAAVCGCSRAFLLDPEHHAFLAGFEARGLPGVVEVIQYLDFDADCEPRPQFLRWHEFEQFVAMHAWEQPADVYDLAAFVHRAIRARVNAGDRMLERADAEARRLAYLEGQVDGMRDTIRVLRDRVTAAHGEAHAIVLPDASIAFHGEPTERARAVATKLPANVRRRIVDAVELAHRFAADGVQLATRWKDLETTMELLVDDGTMSDAGDLIVDVEHAAGLGIVADVLLGIAGIAQHAAGSVGDERHEAVARAVAASAGPR